MLALTVCEPFATLLCLPDGDPRKKRVENRKWCAPARAIGQPLVIHAGKSRRWFYEPDLEEDGLTLADLTFGAILGVGVIEACCPVDRIFAGDFDGRFPWLRGHEHAEGPWCWVLPDVRRLSVPVPWKGEQGLFQVPDDVVALPAGATA